jgi:hypothetical protein
VEAAREDVSHRRTEIPPAAVESNAAAHRLRLGLVLTSQYAGLATNRENGTDAAVTNHFLIRRAVFVIKADVSPVTSAVVAYNFAGSNFAAALINWEPSPRLAFDFGLRKVNLSYEEHAPSYEVKAMETSPVTRYFVESNNGRRLGAASYRIGVFVEGQENHLVWGAALTNPERIDDATLVSTSGNFTNNRIALWGNVGVTGKLREGEFVVGVGAASLPDQGGAGVAKLGKGYDLSLYNVYADMTAGRARLMGEYLMASVEAGKSAERRAAPTGYYFQPSFMLTDEVEAVARYSRLDTDGRGVNPSDAVRLAPGGEVMDILNEFYFGGNWYVKASNLKLSLGVLYAKSSGPLSGVPGSAKTYGVRSQMQVKF